MQLFISDFHMGSPILKNIDKVISLFNLSNIEEIYMIGDIFDVWENHIDKIVAKYFYFIQEINSLKKPVYVLVGNHDPSIEKMREIFYNQIVLDKIETEIGGKKTLITHGHEVDGTKEFTKYVFFFQYYSEKWFKLNPKGYLRDLWYSILKWKSGLTDTDLVLYMEKELYELYKGKYDMVIAGHTHVAKIVNKPDLIYVNTGCVLHKPTYITLDNNVMTVEDL